MDSELSSVDEYDNTPHLVETSDEIQDIELNNEDTEDELEIEYNEEEDYNEPEVAQASEAEGHDDLEVAGNAKEEEEEVNEQEEEDDDDDDEEEEDEDDVDEEVDEEELNDDYQPSQKKQRISRPSHNKKTTRLSKAGKTQSQTTQTGRVSLRARKQIDYKQSIDEDEFLEDFVDEPPAVNKKRKAKIEIVEEEDDDENDAEDAQIEALQTKSHRRSQMLEDLLGIHAKRHGNKKDATSEEMQLKKAESARRRKDFIEKRMEEEKRDVVNKLLKRRAAKARPNQVTLSDENSTFEKPRRPYISIGLTRTIYSPQYTLYATEPEI